MRCRGQACRDSRRNRKVKQPMAGKRPRASRLNLRHAKLAAGIVWWRHCGGGGLIPRGLGGLPGDEGQHVYLAQPLTAKDDTAGADAGSGREGQKSVRRGDSSLPCSRHSKFRIDPDDGGIKRH